MLYFLVANILIPKIKPDSLENVSFAINMLSAVKFEEAPKKEPIQEPQKEPTPEPVKAQPEIVKEEIIPEPQPEPVRVEPVKPTEKPVIAKPIIENIIEKSITEKPAIEKKAPLPKVEPKQDIKKQKIKEAEEKKRREKEEKAKKEEEAKRQLELQTVVISAIYDDKSLNNASPKYPIFSKKEGEEGEVLLLVKIDANGNPTEIILASSSGYERLDNASMYAVKQWKFKPAKNKFGGNIESIVQIPFVFKLQNEN